MIPWQFCFRNNEILHNRLIIKSSMSILEIFHQSVKFGLVPVKQEVVLISFCPSSFLFLLPTSRKLIGYMLACSRSTTTQCPFTDRRVVFWIARIPLWFPPTFFNSHKLGKLLYWKNHILRKKLNFPIKLIFCTAKVSIFTMFFVILYFFLNKIKISTFHKIKCFLNRDQ